MTQTTTERRQRLRLNYAKTERVKYIGHLDLMLAWERTLRRARLPLAYSQGYNPRPKMQAANSLPLGTMGREEILDVTLQEPVDLIDAETRIKQALPRGIRLNLIFEVPLKTATLQPLVRRAEYRVVVETDCSAETLTERTNTLLAATEIIQTRRRRKRQEQFNLRPMLYQLQLVSVADGDAELFMELAAGQHGNLRPQAVLKALQLEKNWASFERLQIIFDTDVQIRPIEDFAG